jgi:hypothetical protein
MIASQHADVSAYPHARPCAPALIQSSVSLVWCFNHNGLTWPEKWPQLPHGTCDFRRPVVVAFVRLTAEEWCEPLDVLAARYPMHLCEPTVQQ